MGSLGFQEIAVILVIALIVFGPKKLPQIGRSLGQAMRELRNISQEFTSVINVEDEPETDDSKEGDENVGMGS
jgi:sec-independent protein translocase protein TatA